jgi:hypothetical protein
MCALAFMLLILVLSMSFIGFLHLLGADSPVIRVNKLLFRRVSILNTPGLYLCRRCCILRCLSCIFYQTWIL